MNDVEIKQLCLDASNAAIAVFDAVDENGVNAPLEDIQTVLKLKRLIDSTEKLRVYYLHRNLGRMMALGINPEDLLKMAESPAGQARIDALVKAAEGG